MMYILRLYQNHRTGNDSYHKVQTSTHQSQLDREREESGIEDGLKDDDHRRGHGLDDLVCPDGVRLQREVRQHNEAAECQRHRDHVFQWQRLEGKQAKTAAQHHANGRKHKVDTRQRHVRKMDVSIYGLVE